MGSVCMAIGVHRHFPSQPPEGPRLDKEDMIKRERDFGGNIKRSIS